MSRKFLSLLLGLVLFALPAMAQAAVTSAFDTTGLLNKIKFSNFEVFVQQDANSPVGYNIVTPGTVGSQLVSIFSASEVYVYNPTTTQFDLKWRSGPSDYLLGYSVQDVVSASAAGVITYSNPSFDPYGLLGAGEQLRMYTSSTDWVINGNVNADLNASLVANATKAVFASFGDSGNGVNGAQFNPWPPLPGPAPLGMAGYALDAVIKPAGWVFDKSQSFGSDIAGIATISPIPSQTTQWQARSDDPVSFAVVPEPATLAMWGSFLAIGAVVAVRRRRK